MSGADGYSKSVDCAEGRADLRAVVGARSCCQAADVELADEDMPICEIDIRGKPHVTVYVTNSGQNAATMTLTWYITDVGYSETIAVGAGATVITDFERAAHRVDLVGQADQETTEVTAGMCATI